MLVVNGWEGQDRQAQRARFLLAMGTCAWDARDKAGSGSAGDGSTNVGDHAAAATANTAGPVVRQAEEEEEAEAQG